MNVKLRTARKLHKLRTMRKRMIQGNISRSDINKLSEQIRNCRTCVTR